MKKQLEFIQAIRGIAAVLVVYFHTGHTPKFGAFGVDIFFVLSGAVMAMLMAQGSSGADFLLRRLVRIVPLYFLATTAAYAVSCLLPSARTSGNIPAFVDYLKSIAFIPHEARNGEIVPVLGVGWTLNYEIGFYLCCSAACALSLKYRALWTTVIVALAACVAGLFFASTPAGRFYSNPMLLEFVAGLGVWALCSRLRLGQSSVLLALPVVLALGVMAWSESTNLEIVAGAGEWNRPLRYLLPAAVIVGFAILAEGAFTRLREPVRRALVLIGDASYAIYLTHVFVIGALSLLLAKTAQISVSSSLGASITVIASTMVGVAVYLWMELPVQRLLRKWRKQST